MVMTADGAAVAAAIAAAVTGAQGAGVTLTARDTDIFVPDTTQLTALDTYLKSAKWQAALPFADEHGTCVRYWFATMPYSLIALTVHVGTDNGL